MDNTNRALAVPHRENSLRQSKKRMLTHARLPGTKAILIREIPKQSVWKPRPPSNDAHKSTFFPDRKLLRQASINRRARSDGFNLDSGSLQGATESCPLLPDIDNALDEVRNNQGGTGDEHHMSIHMSNAEKEDIESGVPAIDLARSTELSSPSISHISPKTKGAPDSVRSKPLPNYVPLDTQGQLSRRSSRVKRASRSNPTAEVDE